MTPLEPAGPAVVVPVRNGGPPIAELVRAVLAQGADLGLTLELAVVDDGSTDATAALAGMAGARVIRRDAADGGNPAAARNLGFRGTTSDPVVFLDADCLPAAGWLRHLLAACDAGHAIVGGALDLPLGLPLTARVDYYGGWYHLHSRRPTGAVPNHPPGNLAVRRAVFATAGGFNERQPVAYAHEELAWQAAARAQGHTLWFEPRARVWHTNRPGFAQLLRRSYRWGYSAIEAKAGGGATRLAWLSRHPWWQLALALPMIPLQTAYIVAAWARAGVLEPILLLPWLLAARTAYIAGLCVGGIRWLRAAGVAPEHRPRWE